MDRPYEITGYDSSLADIANRFGVAADEIIMRNPSLRGVITAQSAQSSMPESLVGTTIDLGRDDSGFHYDWQPYTAKAGQSLADVCATVGKDPRFRYGPHWWVTPDVLLNSYENADVRAGHGADVASVKLAAGEQVNIPFPANRGATSAVPVTPNGTANVTLAPQWLSELKNYYEWIRNNTRVFNRKLAEARRLQRSGVKEIGLLNALDALIALMIDHPSRPRELVAQEEQSLQAFRNTLHDTMQAVFDEMDTRYFENTKSDVLDQAKTLGNGILSHIREARFVELVQKLAATPARFPKTTSELCFALRYVYESLGNSPLADAAFADIDPVAKYLAGVKPVPVDQLPAGATDIIHAVQAIGVSPKPNSAIGALLTIDNLIAASGGNLPGASSLAVAFVRLAALYSGRAGLRAAAASAGVSPTKAEAAANWLALCVNALGGTDAQRTELAGMAGNVLQGVLDQKPPKTIMEAVEVPQWLRSLDASVSDTVMTDHMSVGFFSFVNLMCFALAYADLLQNGWTAQTGTEVAAGLVGTAQVGGMILGLMEYLDKSAISSLGKFCAVAGVLIGVFQTAMAIQDARSGGSAANAWVTGISTVGSCLLAMSLFFEPAAPFLAAVGGVIVVGATIYGIVTGQATIEDFKNLGRSTAEVYLLQLVDAFTKSPTYVVVSGNVASLPPKLASLRQAITNLSLLEIDASQRRTVTEIVGDLPDMVNAFCAAAP